MAGVGTHGALGISVMFTTISRLLIIDSESSTTLEIIFPVNVKKVFKSLIRPLVPHHFTTEGDEGMRKRLDIDFPWAAIGTKLEPSSLTFSGQRGIEAQEAACWMYACVAPWVQASKRFPFSSQGISGG